METREQNGATFREIQVEAKKRTVPGETIPPDTVPRSMVKLGLFRPLPMRGSLLPRLGLSERLAPW
jgi:hypothetical protein